MYSRSPTLYICTVKGLYIYIHKVFGKHLENELPAINIDNEKFSLFTRFIKQTLENI